MRFYFTFVSFIIMIVYYSFKMCFGPGTQGAGIQCQNTSQIQTLNASHLKKKKKCERCWNLELARQ